MSDGNLPYVVVFIPAFNEEGSIESVIRKIQEHYVRTPEVRGYRTEVIVVDDGSTDRTVAISRAAGVQTVVSHIKNRGLGASTRTAMQRAYEMGADIAVKIDADFQHDPDDIDKVVRPIIDDVADSVFGTRFRGGLQYTMPVTRAVGNRFFSWLVSKLTGLVVTDGQTGLMAFGRKYLQQFTIIADYNETQQLILDSYRKNMRIIEVPVLFHKRTAGKSFISWRYPFKVLPTILRHYVRIHPLRVFTPAAAVLLLCAAATAVSRLLSGGCLFTDTLFSLWAVGGILLLFM
ncbi:MAG: glycosyltransferase family 2 protein, partial [Geobacteraceae bacterium]|nr:glycosyltransferase family 2 protein [Geobacteraceae bacterium]